MGGGRFPVKFYLTAMMFIIFDIEIIFLFPWAVTFDSWRSAASSRWCCSWSAVSVAYVYEWRRGGLEWD